MRRRTGREPLLKPPPRRLRHELFGQTRGQDDDLHRIPSTMSPVCCAAPPMPCDPPRGEHHDGRSAREKPHLQERLDVVATVAPDRRTLLAIPLGGSGPGTGLVMEYTLPERAIRCLWTPRHASPLRSVLMQCTCCSPEPTAQSRSRLNGPPPTFSSEIAATYTERSPGEDPASFDLPSGPRGPSPKADG